MAKKIKKEKMVISGSVPMPSPQAQHWVLGMEDVEELTISFIYTEVFSLTSTTGNPITSEELERLCTLTHMTSQSGKRRKDVARFLHKKMVKAIARQSRRIMELDQHIYGRVTSIDSERSFDRFNNSYRTRISARREDPNSSFGAQTAELDYFCLEQTDEAFFFRSSNSRWESLYGRSTPTVQSTGLTYDRANIRVPKYVFDNLVSGNVLLFIPFTFDVKEMLSRVNDWLFSNAAPVNLDRLDPVDAIRQAKEWHERIARQHRAERAREGDIHYDPATHTSHVRVNGQWIAFHGQVEVRLLPNGHIQVNNEQRGVVPFVSDGRREPMTFLESMRGPRRSAQVQIPEEPENGHLINGQIGTMQGMNIVRDDELNVIAARSTGTSGPVVSTNMNGRTYSFSGRTEYLHHQIPKRGPKHDIQVSESDYSVVWEFEGWQLLALETFAAFQRESQLMAHCIGESRVYWEKKCNPVHEYVPMSLRKDGRAYATLDYYGEKGFTQLKGLVNRPLMGQAAIAFIQFLEHVRKHPIYYAPKNLATFLPEDYRIKIKSEREVNALAIEGGTAKVFHGSAYSVWSYLRLGSHINPKQFGDDSIVDLLDKHRKGRGHGLGILDEVAFAPEQAEEVLRRFDAAYVNAQPRLHLYQQAALDSMLQSESRVFRPSLRSPVVVHEIDMSRRVPIDAPVGRVVDEALISNPCRDISVLRQGMATDAHTGERISLSIPQSVVDQILEAHARGLGVPQHMLTGGSGDANDNG